MRNADLTPEQLACVEYSGRDTLLVKGPPGSGKTWVLLFRGHALAQAPNDTVQFITFTNRFFARRAAWLAANGCSQSGMLH